MTSTMTTSYSTFSIASLIGHQQVSGDDTTLLGGISATKMTVSDHPDGASDHGIATTQRETTIATPLPADVGISAADDANTNCDKGKSKGRCRYLIQRCCTMNTYSGTHYKFGSVS